MVYLLIIEIINITLTTPTSGCNRYALNFAVEEKILVIATISFERIHSHTNDQFQSHNRTQLFGTNLSVLKQRKTVTSTRALRQ